MQLNMFDFIKDERFKDDNEILADKIIDEICNFVDKELMSLFEYPIKSKKTEFDIWSHVPNQGRNISIYYHFEHKWESDKGRYKSTGNRDEEVNYKMFESGLIKKVESYKKGIECLIFMSPGILNFYVKGIDKPLEKDKKKDLKGDYEDENEFDC